MFKAMLVGIVVICPSLLGFFLSHQLSRRIGLIGELLEVMEKMKTYIGFWLFPMPRIFSKLACEGNLTRSFFEKCGERLKKGGEPLEKIWREECRTLFSGFSGNEQEIFLLLGSTLGKSDANLQIEAVERAKGMLLSELEQAREQQKKYMPLMKSLGIIFGILAGVILI